MGSQIGGFFLVLFEERTILILGSLYYNDIFAAMGETEDDGQRTDKGQLKKGRRAEGGGHA